MVQSRLVTLATEDQHPGGTRRRRLMALAEASLLYRKRHLGEVVSLQVYGESQRITKNVAPARLGGASSTILLRPSWIFHL